MRRLALFIFVGLFPHLALAQGWQSELEIPGQDSVSADYRAGVTEAERLGAADSLRFVRTASPHVAGGEPWLGVVSRHFHELLYSLYRVDVRVSSTSPFCHGDGTCSDPEPPRPGYVAGFNSAMAREVERRHGVGVLAGLERSARVIGDVEAFASDWKRWEVQERRTGLRVEGLRSSYSVPSGAAAPPHPVFVEVEVEPAACHGVRPGSMVGGEAHLFVDRPGIIPEALRIASGLTYVRTSPDAGLSPGESCYVLVPVAFVPSEDS